MTIEKNHQPTGRLTIQVKEGEAVTVGEATWNVVSLERSGAVLTRADGLQIRVNVGDPVWITENTYVVYTSGKYQMRTMNGARRRTWAGKRRFSFVGPERVSRK